MKTTLVDYTGGGRHSRRQVILPYRARSHRNKTGNYLQAGPQVRELNGTGSERILFHLPDHAQQIALFGSGTARRVPPRRVMWEGSTEIGTVLKSSGQELIHHWNRLQDGVLRRATFDNHYRGLRSIILDTLESGASCSDSKTAEACRRPGNECYSLFVFVHHAGVSPTNNLAERAPRKSVIFRKLSFGTEASSGSQSLTVILSEVETGRRLNSHCLTFIKDAVQASSARHLLRNPFPFNRWL